MISLGSPTPSLDISDFILRHHGFNLKIIKQKYTKIFIFNHKQIKLMQAPQTATVTFHHFDADEGVPTNICSPILESIIELFPKQNNNKPRNKYLLDAMAAIQTS